MTEAATKAPPQGSPFWHFSLGFYRQPEVAAACIRLQDEAGVDVNLLFFLLWHASLKRQFTAGGVKAVDGAVRDWRQAVVIPLRELRRILKSAPAMIEAGASELFRTRIKGLELESERLQQETLYDLARSGPLGETAPSAAEAAAANIAAYQAICEQRFAQDAVDALLAAFGKQKR